MNEALKPCPFCGCEMEYPYLNYPEAGKHPTHIRCFASKAIVHPENVEAWNTRAALFATNEQAFANEKVKALVEKMLWISTECNADGTPTRVAVVASAALAAAKE